MSQKIDDTMHYLEYRKRAKTNDFADILSTPKPQKRTPVTVFARVQAASSKLYKEDAKRQSLKRGRRVGAEELFQSDYDMLAAANNWHHYHTFRSKHSPPGYPDCITIKGGVMVVAELKVKPNKTSQMQESWLEAYRTFATAHDLADSVIVRVWYPEDWPEITEFLTHV